MAQSGGQISALHLSIAASGGVLLYAALRGVSPLAALKDITSGAPPQVSNEGKKILGPDGAMDPDHIPGSMGSTPWKGVYRKNKVPSLVQTPAWFVSVVLARSGEKYDQGRRWQRGYSDCSSFVGKSLLDLGIEPPGSSVTTDYLGSKDWVEVKSPKAGDLAVNAEHMAIFLAGHSGIGQQNSRRNVARDSMDNLMANTGSGYKILRLRRWT